MAWPCGFLLVDKPGGVTSRDVVDSVQRRIGPPRRRRRGRPRFRCGHAGTLDPLATGLLVVLVGAATRLSNFLLGHDKTYVATFRFGEETDSLDADGEIVGVAPADFSDADLESALAASGGEVSQVPPLVSALKRDGRPLYERVRAGEDVAPPDARTVRLDEFRVLEAPGAPDDRGRCDGRFLIRCSSGTYVRSCARDLAARLGTVAHVRELRREAVGPFDAADALTLNDDLDADALRALLRPPAEALPEAPALVVSADEAVRLRQGWQPPVDWLDRLSAAPRPVAPGREPLWRALDGAGALVAVGRMCEDPERPGEAAPRTAAVFAPAPKE